MRELCGAISAEKANRGLLVTCGTFSLEAMRFAKDLPIGLMDGNTLLQMTRGELTSNVLERTPVAEGIGLHRRQSTQA